MPFSVDSEVGRLRKVIVHRPGLEQRRLTPENAEELLFDDVIWVRKAKVEHAAFVQVLKERGVEVFDAEDLLLETLEVPEGKGWILDQVLEERQVGQYLARSGREWARRRERPRCLELPHRRDDQGRPRGRRRPLLRLVGPDGHDAPAAAELPLPARPVVVDLRRRDAQPDDQAGAPAGDGDHGGDLPLPPDVHGRRRREGLVRRRRAGLGPLHDRGRRRRDDRQRRGDDRHGRAHVAAVGRDPRPQPVRARAPRGSCWPSSCRRRAPTCTSTRS